MDSVDSSGGSMDSLGRGGDDDEEFSSCLAAADAGSIALSSFLMNGYAPAHQLELLHQRDNTQRPPPPPLPAFDALPDFFDQLARPGLLPHRNHQQLFQLGCGVGSDELGVLLPPSARSSSANLTGVLQLPADLGCCPSPRQIRAGSMGEATDPSLDLATDPPPKPVEGRPAGRNNNNGVPRRRNPKKRTRASRRAPMTVLTTDTSNFRAMVQEFTGIPAPPFDAAASLFQRGRFDLFGTTFSSIAAGTGPSIPSSSPSYLLRPLTQRLSQSSPQPPTSFSIPSATTAHNNASTSTELSFPLLSDNNGNGPHNASLSQLEFGQALAKHPTLERGQEQTRLGPPGGINNVVEEFCLGRQEGVGDTPHSAQNVEGHEQKRGRYAD